MKRLILPLALLANVAEAQLVIAPNEGTAARRRVPVYLVDVTDGVTAETAIAIAANNDSDCADSTDECCVSKAGGTLTYCTGTLTHLGRGQYYYEFAAAEVDTVGSLTVEINDSAARPFIGFAQVGFSPDVFAPTGTAQSSSGLALNQVKLASTASGTDNIYVNNEIVFTSGTGGGQTRRITAYNGTTKVATLNRKLITAADTTTTYALIAGDAKAANLQGASN